MFSFFFGGSQCWFGVYISRLFGFSSFYLTDLNNSQVRFLRLLVLFAIFLFEFVYYFLIIPPYRQGPSATFWTRFYRGQGVSLLVKSSILPTSQYIPPILISVFSSSFSFRASFHDEFLFPFIIYPCYMANCSAFLPPLFLQLIPAKAMENVKFIKFTRARARV